MMELSKFNNKMLKCVNLYVGKNVLGVIKGKINLFKSYYNYDFSVRFKPGGGNFYRDFTFGLNAKWNL